MLRRFCLYGFLKNQQYYEPFFWLAFLEKGLSFTMIGLLVGFRELCINLLEVPTGAVADVLGRRRSMIASFLAYIVAFLVFGLSAHVGLLFVAMFFFSIGEAFRTGTHKAMIFDWLARQGREAEKIRVYGLTRSWSKLGSALSVVIAGVTVFMLRRYAYLFLFCLVPYVVEIVNFLGYPAYLDGPRKTGSIREVFGVLGASLRESLCSRGLRRLLAESMGFEGTYKVSKDYVQPMLQAVALAVPVGLYLEGRQREAILIAAVNFVLYLMGSAASRYAGSFAERAGGEQHGARWLWAMALAAFGVLTGGVLLGLVPRAAAASGTVAVVAFVALAVIQNFWRPILVSRVAAYADPAKTATVLSIESQAKSLFAAVIAPLLGLAVDHVPASIRFLPVGLLGLVIAAAMLLTGRLGRATPGAATPLPGDTP